MSTQIKTGDKLICIVRSDDWTKTRTTGIYWKVRKWLTGKDEPSRGPGPFEVVTMAGVKENGFVLLSEYAGCGGFDSNLFIVATPAMIESIESIRTSETVSKQIGAGQPLNP